MSLPVMVSYQEDAAGATVVSARDIVLLYNLRTAGLHVSLRTTSHLTPPDLAIGLMGCACADDTDALMMLVLSG
jgi:hypothetical protein